MLPWPCNSQNCGFPRMVVTHLVLGATGGVGSSLVCRHRGEGAEVVMIARGAEGTRDVEREALKRWSEGR